MQYTRHHRHYVAYVLFFFTGCRRGEILGLDWNHVHRRENYIEIAQTLIMEHGRPTLKRHHAKTERSIRSIPIPTDVRMLFQEVESRQKHERQTVLGWKNPENLVFTGKNGSPVNPSYFSRNFKNICKRLGFPSDLHLHCTRHSWATNMLQCGATITDIHALLGAGALHWIGYLRHGRTSLAEYEKNPLKSGQSPLILEFSFPIPSNKWIDVKLP